MRRLRTVTLLLAAIVAGFIVPLVVSAGPAHASTLHRTTFSDGRYYDLYVPASLPAHPELYLVLPGSGQHVDRAEALYGMQAEADAHHFLIAFAAGWHSLWDAGTCCTVVETNPPNDTAFLDKVVASVRQQYSSMASGIRVVGFSAGGMMAYTYACERSDVVGVAGVSGAWVSTKGCNRPALRVYAINGTADLLVPYTGGYSPYVGATFEPVSELASHFPTGSAYHLHTVDGGAHQWPSFAASEIYSWLR